MTIKTTLLCLGLSLLSTHATADYKCSNGSISIEVTVDGNVPEEYPGMTAAELFDNNHAIRVTEQGVTKFYRGLIASVHDGAGNEGFQAYTLKSRKPLKLEADFYFEHEGWYLSGGVVSPVSNKWITFGEEMSCSSVYGMNFN